MAFSDVIARLAVSLSLDTAAFTTGSRKAQAEAASLQGRMLKVGAGIAGAIGGGLAAVGFSNLIGQAVEMASALSEDAEKLGVTVEALQELRLAANQSGIENETLAGSLARVAKVVGALELGNKAAAKTFEAIGLGAEDLKGKAPEQQLGIIFDALNKLPDAQQRNAIGNQIFGRSFAELLPLVNGGSEGLRKFAEQSRAQGQVSTESAKNLDDLADRWDGFKTALLTATANVVAGLIPIAQKIGAFLDRTRATMAGVHDAIVNMVKGVGTWITGRLNAIWDGAKAKIDTVKGWFFGLYDAVIGHSYIPDMVDGIAAEIGRLDAVLVQPVAKATTKAQRSFRDMAQNTRDLLDRLFPEVGHANSFESDLKLLQGSLSGPALDEAVMRRWRELGGGGGGMGEPNLNGDDIAGGALQAAMEQFDRFTKKAAETSTRVSKSFKDMADATIGAFDKLAGAIKGGGFLDILSAVIGVGLQLGSVGLFGKTIAGRLNKTVPGYAGGTNFHPGGLAMVGERGPELVSLPRGSRVTPNNKAWRGGDTYYLSGNLMTEEFWAAIQRGDVQAANAGARGGVALASYRGSRRLG